MIYKILAALAIIGAIFAGGYKVAEDKYIPQVIALKAQLEAIDLKAKADEQKFKENADVIKDKDSKYRGAIAYYERMLSEAANRTGSGKAPGNPEGMDGTASQSTITGCHREVEARCIDDARVRAGMAEHFRLNQYPTE